MKPLVISFSGIDGAGKSTQIQKLRDYLLGEGVSVSELAFWDDIAVFSRLRASFSRRILAGDGFVGTPERPARRRDKNVQNWVLRVVRSAAYFFDALSLRRAVAKARQGHIHVVIFDRYIYDQLAVLPVSSGWARAYCQLLLRIAPRADVSYLLDAVPEIALARKPEYPLSFLRQYRSSYLELVGLAKLCRMDPGDIEDVHLAIRERLKTHLGSCSEAEVRVAVPA